MQIVSEHVPAVVLPAVGVHLQFLVELPWLPTKKISNRINTTNCLCQICVACGRYSTSCTICSTLGAY